MHHARTGSVSLGAPDVRQVQASLVTGQQQKTFTDWYMAHKETANVKSNIDRYYIE